VETGLATDVDASFQLMKDPYLFLADATLRPGVKHADVERVLLEELAKVATDPVGDAEFERVRRQLLAATAFNTDTITWRSYRCGQLLSTGAANSIGEWYEKLAAVTREQIRDAARDILIERARNVGWFVPENTA
jgi:zinc protease